MTTKERRAQFNRKPKKKISVRNELVAKYGRSCWLCGRGIAYEAVLSIDHVRPLSKGGSSKIHNLRLAHERCNRKRGNGGVPVLLLQSDMRLKKAIPKSVEKGTINSPVRSADILAADTFCSCLFDRIMVWVCSAWNCVQRFRNRMWPVSTGCGARP